MRRWGRLLAAGIIISIATFVAPPGARAGEGLVLSSHTTWDVRPQERLIVVSVDVAATNVVPDTSEGRTYFTGLGIPIPLEATRVSAFGGGVPLGLSVRTEEGVAIADITFSTGVFYQQTYRFRLSFVITDGGGDPARDTWVRSSYVAFGAWPIGSDGTASLEIVLPPGYEATDHLEGLEVTADETATIMRGENLDPATFFTYVIAEREDERVTTSFDVPVNAGPASLVFSAWPDDEGWAPRLSEWLVDGIPVLEDHIGLPYPISGDLRVEEHAHHHLGDYAGYYSFALDTIAVRFDADAFVTLHEAAHVWFDVNLTRERWLTEGFASYYAEVAGTDIGADLEIYELTDDLREHAFPLTEWGDVGAEDLEREDYGYAASLAAARDIAAAAGMDGLQAVWRAVHDERRAYAVGSDDLVQPGQLRVHEWQRLLDLFEIESGADLGAVWVEWIIDDRDAELLSARAAARQAYGATLEALDGWPMPEDVRIAMEWWEFVDATAGLGEIDDVIEDREALEAEAAALELVPTDDLQVAFEERGVQAAATEVREQRDALDAIADARASLAPELTPLEVIGLIGAVDPASTIADAARAYEAGDDAAAAATANEAAAVRAASADQGTTRAVVAGVGVLAVASAGIGFGVRRHRRRDSSHRTA
jgi:hypothetical protein